MQTDGYGGYDYLDHVKEIDHGGCLAHARRKFMDAQKARGKNAIRPFCVGRRNWLFACTPNGAKASADIYSLIETAKANNLEPYKYLRYLFEKIPFTTSEEDYKMLLPMNLKPEQLMLPDAPTFGLIRGYI